MTDITDRSKGYFDHVTKDLSKKKKKKKENKRRSTCKHVIIQVMQMGMQMKRRWDNFYYYRWFADVPKRLKFMQIYSKISRLCKRYKSETGVHVFSSDT